MTEAPGNMALKKKQDHRSLLGSGAGLLLIKLANAGIGFITVAVLAQLLPPEQYGIYLLILTISQFLAMPLQMGIPVLLTREIAVAQAAGRPEVIKGLRLWSRRLLLTGTFLLGGGVIAGYAIVVVAGWPILQNFSWALVLLVVTLIPAVAEMKRVMGILNGYRRPAQSRLPDSVVRPVLLLTIGGLGLWAGWFAEIGLLVVYLLSAVAAAFFGWSLVRRAEGERYEGPPDYYKADWWSALGPLTIFAAATTVKTYSDVLMLGAMDSPESVAFYRVANQIASTALLVQTAVNAVLSPRMAALHSRGDLDQIENLAVKGSRLVLGVTLTFAIVLLLMNVDLFTRLLGENYRSVYGLTVVMAFGMAMSGLFGGTPMVLNMTRREKSTATYAVATAIGNIVLNFALIPFFGAMGAVAATIATNFAMQGLSWNRLRKDLGLRTDAFARLKP